MSNKPPTLSPKPCFLIGFFLAIILLGAIFDPPTAEFYSVPIALLSTVPTGIGAVVMFWFASKHSKEDMFLFLCVLLGNLLGETAVTLYQGLDVAYVIVRLIGGCIVTCLVYHHFVKKIKTQTS